MAENERAELADPKRLEILARTGLLDSPIDEDFDRLTRLASRVVGVPVALVSLVDDHRQFFKSQVGLAEPWASQRETPLSHSFCQYVVTSGRPFIVENSNNDERVKGNLAIPDLAVQAYAGFPIELSDGTILGSFCAIDSSPRTWTDDELSVIEDLTKSVVAEIELRMSVEAAHASERRQAFLAESTIMLSESLIEEEILHRLVTLAVSAGAELADWCSVALLSDGATIERAAVRHRDETLQPLADQLAARFPYDPQSDSVVPRVIATGRLVVVEQVDEAVMKREAPNPQQAEIVKALGSVTAVVAPLTSLKETFGSITFMRSRAEPFNDNDLQVASELARRAAVAIGTARLFRENRIVADTMQRTLLPPELPTVPGVEVDAFYRGPGTATMGGDFYDVFAGRGKRWAAVIGDVQGKGPEAASLIAQAKFTIRAGIMESHRPSRVLRRVNEVLTRSDHERFVTLALAVFQTSGGTLRAKLALGGHPQAVKLSAVGVATLVGEPGTLIGAFPSVELNETDVELQQGEALILYTDGITESRRGDEFFGTDRLLRVTEAAHGRDAPGIVAALSGAVAEFQDEARDDMAILVIRVV